ncbi:hypothetical protein [Richelia sinica]|uniref:hypothetical protein n=1 Tax=Richelia sinica TaxID=1357545 RepID=UPI001684BCEC|nr:hypothetical protein [Richelia sinica]MBD2667259.1 hypothetical protein [Richelia sinica FACHB-800]
MYTTLAPETKLKNRLKRQKRAQIKTYQQLAELATTATEKRRYLGLAQRIEQQLKLSK